LGSRRSAPSTRSAGRSSGATRRRRGSILPSRSSTSWRRGRSPAIRARPPRSRRSKGVRSNPRRGGSARSWGSGAAASPAASPRSWSRCCGPSPRAGATPPRWSHRRRASPSRSPSPRTGARAAGCSPPSTRSRRGHGRPASGPTRPRRRWTCARPSAASSGRRSAAPPPESCGLLCGRCASWTGGSYRRVPAPVRTR
jgi:hypothetical protein